MRRALFTPVAISLGAAVFTASCSTAETNTSGTDTSETETSDTGTADSGPGRAPGETPPDTGADVGDHSPDEPAEVQPLVSGLQFFGDCPALLDHLQREASERVTPWGLEGGVGVFDDMAVEEMAVDEMAADAEAPAELAESAPVSGTDFSGTNTQEAGVDEGDIVETDGDYVYTVDMRGLRVVSVADAEQVAFHELPDGQQQMLLAGDRLVVVTSSWSSGPDTIVSSFDVTDPTQPELLRRSHLEGDLVATRAADGAARLVLETSLNERLPFVMPTDFGLDEERALERNREIIEESTIDDWMPRWFDEMPDGAFGPLQPALDCADVAAPPEFSGLGISWIASVDLVERADPVGSAGVVSVGETVYASTDNLYLATRARPWLGPWQPMPTDASATEVVAEAPEDDTGPPTLIHQFALGPGTDASYVASGAVPGRLLNQFAMSEHDGDLRVATTIDARGFGQQSESMVHVLRPQDGELATLSSIGGLGRDEEIFAVRFMGDVGYVVTFRQIDPLYVLDLSEPENPVLEGELKIPGYSAYLHPVGEGLLLGVGQDATDEGRALGTQLSLFDVSEPTDPQRIDTLSIGGWSDVEWDHRAFLFWGPDGTIALPVSPGWGDCAGVECPAEKIGPAGGAVVAELDGRSLALRGTISHESPADTGCWNPLQRSIAIGDELVTVGLDQLQFSDRTSLVVRDAVQWGQPEDFGCWWYWE